MNVSRPHSDSCIDGAVDEYLRSLKAHRYSPKSIDTYGTALSAFAAFLCAENVERVQNVSAKHIERYRCSLIRRSFKPASLATYLRPVKQLFVHLQEQQQLFVNPTDGIPPVRRQRRLLNVPSEENIRRLLAQPDTSTLLGVRDRALLETAYGAGLRRQELSFLKVDDFHVSGQTVRVMGKGSKERVVPTGEAATHWVKSYIETTRRVLQHQQQTDALWLGRGGRPLSYHAPPIILRKYALAADVSVSMHGLRRACATHLLQHGAHPVQIQMLLGHASLKHLSQYLHLSITELKHAHAGSNPGR